MQVNDSVKVYGVLDTVEYKDRLCSEGWYIYGYAT